MARLAEGEPHSLLRARMSVYMCPLKVCLCVYCMLAGLYVTERKPTQDFSPHLAKSMRKKWKYQQGNTSTIYVIFNHKFPWLLWRSSGSWPEEPPQTFTGVCWSHSCYSKADTKQICHWSTVSRHWLSAVTDGQVMYIKYVSHHVNFMQPHNVLKE